MLSFSGGYDPWNPVTEGNVQKYTREMMVEDWIPYQEQLKQIWKKWYERFTQDGTFDRCEEGYMRFQKARREQMMASMQE